MMAQPAPLLSAQWFRIASLRPRLDAQLTVERIAYRRQIWHVLTRADGSRSFRLNAAAYAFVGRCDGGLSVQRLWDLLLAEKKDDVPTQEELLRLLARMHAAALIVFDRRPDFGPFGTSGAPLVEEKRAHQNSLLSFRIPLGSPDRWLDRVTPFTRLPVHAGGAGRLGRHRALRRGDGLARCRRDRRARPDLARDTARIAARLAGISGHQGAARSGARAGRQALGGTVREWGITFLMFVPIPYVDASAASGFPKTSRRVIVSAAGIMVELVLAALALAIALAAEAGWLRDLSFVIVFIGAGSTLLVNGNPLLRFDGYHMLADALEIPNLARRSAGLWTERLSEFVLRVPAERTVIASPGEAPWLWAYAPAALLYRLAASASLIICFGALSYVLGAGLAAYLAWTVIGRPLLAFGRFLRGPTLGDVDRARALRLVAAAGTAAVALATLLPLPFSSVEQGVVWPPEQALVRAGTDGFIGQVQVEYGQQVQRGQPLLALHSPMLEAERARIEAHIRALETERFQTLRGDPARSVSLELELESATAEQSLIDEKTTQLAVRAQADGSAVIVRAEDLPGRFVRRGALLGHVVTREPAVVRVAVPHEQAALVQTKSRAVTVRLVEDSHQSWRGELVRDVSGSARRLPSPALGNRSGGSIATDPNDRDGLTPVNGVVVADIRLPEHVAARIGSRAWVRFDHGYAPLALQAARRLQQVFLKHFNPAQ